MAGILLFSSRIKIGVQGVPKLVLEKTKHKKTLSFYNLSDVNENFLAVVISSHRD